MKATILKLFRRNNPNLTFPPLCPPIASELITPGSCLLFLRRHGNDLTQSVGEKLYGCSYVPEFHAALVVDDNRVVNVGLTTCVKKLEDMQTSTTRIDVIKYPQLKSEQIEIIIEQAYRYTGQFYDVQGFANFGTKYISVLKHLIRPSSKNPFCSEMCTEVHARAGSTISFKPAFDTAPWDLRTHAVATPAKAQLFTWFVGDDFGQ